MWNYRLVRRKFPDGNSMLGICEAFNDENGLVWAITTDHIDIAVNESFGETVNDIKDQLNWMLKACSAPILDFDNIPEDGAKHPMDNPMLDAEFDDDD